MGGVIDETENDLVLFGAPSEVIESARTNKEQVLFDVFADNWQAVQLFCRLATQWKIAIGMGAAVYLGLDYTAIDFLFKIENVSETAKVFAELQIMERTALKYLNKDKGAS